MFTNTPFEHSKKIITDNYDVIIEETCVPSDIFLFAVSFIVEDCSFFTFQDKIYRQSFGLTMGNSLSQVLADVSTNHALTETLLQMKDDDISFVFKYVDTSLGLWIL